MQTSTLRPGYLVSLKSSQRGNVSYDKREIEAEHITSAGAKEAEWATRRKIADPDEHDRASKARMLARNVIAKVCVNTAFGHLCPEDKGALLDAAQVESKRIVDEFNATAKYERISVYALAGRIAPDDEAAVKAINSEVRELLEDMQEGIKNLDVKAVREAANQARLVGSMLSPDAQVRVQFAIDAAREVATRIKAAGEQAAVEVDLVAIRRINEQRMAFLDLDGEVESVALPTQGRAVDFEAVEVARSLGVDAARQPAFQLEV